MVLFFSVWNIIMFYIVVKYFPLYQRIIILYFWGIWSYRRIYLWNDWFEYIYQLCDKMKHSRVTFKICRNKLFFYISTCNKEMLVFSVAFTVWKCCKLLPSSKLHICLFTPFAQKMMCGNHVQNNWDMIRVFLFTT